MEIPAPHLRVGAVVALKRVDTAKSRLGSLADPLRRRLAETMAADTLAALSAAVDQLLVVSDQPWLESRLRRLGVSAAVAAEPGRVGMNGALSHGDQLLRDGGCESVLACVGDLPALRPATVRLVLGTVATEGRSFVADASGVGTTMLLARGTALDPRFTGHSAAAHRASGATALTDDRLGARVPDARRDVDTEADLSDAARLGVGRLTSALIDPSTGALGRYETVTVSVLRDPAGDQLAFTSTGARILLPAAALQDGLREAHPGQRLHAVTNGARVLAAWP